MNGKPSLIKMYGTGYMRITDKLSKIYDRAFNSKRWHNVAEFCDRKYHPFSFSYRRYKRGKNRCIECGARIGDRIMIRKSGKEFLIDNISGRNTMLDMLRQRGAIKCV